MWSLDHCPLLGQAFAFIADVLIHLPLSTSVLLLVCLHIHIHTYFECSVKLLPPPPLSLLSLSPCAVSNMGSIPNGEYPHEPPADPLRQRLSEREDGTNVYTHTHTHTHTHTPTIVATYYPALRSCFLNDSPQEGTSRVEECMWKSHVGAEFLHYPLCMHAYTMRTAGSLQIYSCTVDSWSPV